MKLRTTLVFTLALSASALALGCASSPDGSDETTDNDDEAALSVAAKKIAGSYTGTAAGRPPTFDSLNLRPDGTFDAVIDTGIRCFRAPCPSSNEIYGTYSAGAKTFTLKALQGADPSEYYGRYNYKAKADGSLKVTRNGQLWSNWNNVLERAAGILPDDATDVVAETKGGGFTPQPPPGSTCAWGAQKYSLSIESKTISWTVCAAEANNQPMHPRSGQASLTKSQVNDILDTVRAASVSTRDICGADKPLLTLSVSSSSEGTKKYEDAFYACQNDGTYIDGIDAIFGAMRAVAH